MVRSGKFHGVVDVLDNPFPAHVRELSFSDGLFRFLGHLPPKTFLVVATFFLEFVKLCYHSARQLFRSIFIGLVNKTPFIVDLDDPALRGQHDECDAISGALLTSSAS